MGRLKNKLKIAKSKYSNKMLNLFKILKYLQDKIHDKNSNKMT